jgi:YHS domain-containing protein
MTQLNLERKIMPNKHFCQGPDCHTKTTQDRFLKSRGVVRGKYAYSTPDRTPNQWGWTPNGSDVYFCSQACKLEWLSTNMENIEQGRPIEFIRHRRESQGYHKVTNDNRWGASHSIERVDNRTELE